MDNEKIFSHKSLSLRVVEHLKEEIFLERYKGGDRILESKVAEDLDISRAPVREAIKELESQGLITNIPRKGSFVVEFTEKDIQELFDIRIILEMRILKKLIEEERLTSTDYKNITRITDDMVKVAREEDDKDLNILNVNKKDMAFHKYLWDKSGSKWTKKILSNLFNQLQLAMLIDFKKETNRIGAAQEHYRIIEKLKGGDLEGTRKAIIDHIVIYKEDLKEKIV